VLIEREGSDWPPVARVRLRVMGRPRLFEFSLDGELEHLLEEHEDRC
jgi:hypothetical protein